MTITGSQRFYLTFVLWWSFLLLIIGALSVIHPVGMQDVGPKPTECTVPVQTVWHMPRQNEPRYYWQPWSI